MRAEDHRRRARLAVARFYARRRPGGRRGPKAGMPELDFGFNFDGAGQRCAEARRRAAKVEKEQEV